MNTILNQEKWVEKMFAKTLSWYTFIAISKYIARDQRNLLSKSFLKVIVSDLPEPCALRRARTVLRGEGVSDDIFLPDPQSGWELRGNKIWLSKIGAMPIRFTRPIEGCVK